VADLVGRIVPDSYVFIGLISFIDTAVRCNCLTFLSSHLPILLIRLHAVRPLKHWYSLVSSYYRFKLVIGGRDRHVLDDSGGVVWTLLPGVRARFNQDNRRVNHRHA